MTRSSVIDQSVVSPLCEFDIAFASILFTPCGKDYMILESPYLA